MSEEVTIITLEEPEFAYKTVANVGKYINAPVWIYLAKLTYESFIRLWQQCETLEQFQTSYQALGAGTCRLETEDEEPNPVESVPKILFTVSVLRKRGVQLKEHDATAAEDYDYWENLRAIAFE